MKSAEYRINPEETSIGTAKTFDIVFKFVPQENIPDIIKIKGLFPPYITKDNISFARNRYVLSFFLPLTKKKWIELYNMKYVEFGRNFFSASTEVGTKSVAVSDRRYKSGFRNETRTKWGKVLIHHIFVPWTSLTRETSDGLKNEFSLIYQRALNNHKIGRIFLPLFTLIATIHFGANNTSIGALGILTLVLLMFLYYINPKNAESKSQSLANNIETAYLNQNEDLINKFLPYSEIEYVNLIKLNSTNELV